MGQKIEGIGDTPIEWRPENLKVIQPSSDRSKLPRGTQIGSILLGEKEAKQPLKTIPIRMWDSRQMWSPDKDEAKVLCWSPDGKLGSKYGLCKDCQYGKFDTETNRSACNKQKTVLSITDDLSTVFTTTFSKTNYKNGFDWGKMMTKAGVAPFRRVYELKTETSKKYKNVESLLVDTQNQVTPAEHLTFLEAMFTKVNADREAYLKKFEEVTRSRQVEHPVLEDRSGVADSVQTLPAPATSEQSVLAKKYEL